MIIALNWALAGPWQAHVHSLALTEHYQHPIDNDCAAGLCRFGDNDGGRAFGILQMHMPYLQEWYKLDGPYRAAVGDTVPDAQIKAAAAFLTVEVSHIGLDLAIQSQNLGVAAVLAGQRNAEYLSRWSSSFQRLRGGVS